MHALQVSDLNMGIIVNMTFEISISHLVMRGSELRDSKVYYSTHIMLPHNDGIYPVDNSYI